MRYVAAYLLAVLGGNSSPSESDLKSIIESVGVGFDEERASLVCKNLQGKDVNEVGILRTSLLFQIQRQKNIQLVDFILNQLKG